MTYRHTEVLVGRLHYEIDTTDARGLCGRAGGLTIGMRSRTVTLIAAEAMPRKRTSNQNTKMSILSNHRSWRVCGCGTAGRQDSALTANQMHALGCLHRTAPHHTAPHAKFTTATAT